MFAKIVFAFMACLVMVGCASNPDKASDPHIVRVVEGDVVSIEVKRLTSKAEFYGDGAMLAAEVGSTGATLLALVAVDALLDSNKPKNGQYYEHTFYTILDDKTKESIEISSKYMSIYGVPKAEEGDRLRALQDKNKGWRIYNLTKNPELDEKTR